MIDTSFVLVAARKLAQKQAGSILQAAFWKARNDFKSSTTDSINEHQLTKNSSLSQLHQQAEVLIKGAVGDVLMQRATSIKARMYHLDGINGVK